MTEPWVLAAVAGAAVALIIVLAARRSGKAAAKPLSLSGRSSAQIVLRDERSETDSRRLAVGYADNGDLVIEGQDFGAGVRAFLDAAEYEWSLTIKKADIGLLEAALSGQSSLLEVLRDRFSGPAASKLEVFIKDHGIPFKFWSRIGD